MRAADMGTMIVLEGIDGSGKSTQFSLLCDRLAREGAEFMRVSFPAYGEPSSALVRMYLDGQFGSAPDAVNPYAASTFFAVDRFASYKRLWGDFYDRGGTVVTDRYTTSNAIHQGAKLPHGRRAGFFGWLSEFEFNLMGLPAPDLVLYMDIPAELAAERRRGRESATGAVPDIHERDLSYLEECRECGLDAAEYYGWRKVRCCDGGQPRGADDIHTEIWSECGKLILRGGAAV
ncbi:MAG: thymidylate kinase [Oscillospiraceae bacterium]|jgi:dTMP kinase|nr:thymidylate kinase [Oscillospiraceae bacterium]